MACLDYILLSDIATIPSSWTEKMDCGGVRKPETKFVAIFVQIECWLRELVSTNQLATDPLVNLKATFMDYQLLQNSFRQIFPQASNIEQTVLKNSVELFLDIFVSGYRGVAFLCWGSCIATPGYQTAHERVQLLLHSPSAIG